MRFSDSPNYSRRDTEYAKKLLFFSARSASLREKCLYCPIGLTVLPGSRHGEIKRIGPVFRSVVQDMLVEMPDLRIFIPSVAHRVDDVRAMFAGIDVTILDPRPLNTAESERRKKTCYTLSTAALAASGTVSLELAATRTPMVIAYRQAPVTAFMMRRLAKISTVTLVNIVSETRAVPEFLLEDCTPEAMLPAIRSLLGDKTAAATQQSAEDVTMTALGEGGPPPGLRAARSVLEYLRRARH